MGTNGKLVLTRRIGEKVVIGGIIEVEVIEVRGGRAKLAFCAPPYISVDRAEVYASKVREGVAAVNMSQAIISQANNAINNNTTSNRANIG